MIRVKICGVNSPEAFDAAVAAGADWIGFVHHPASPRHVSPPQAAALSARHPGGPARVALLVAPADADIDATLTTLRPDALQLYADEARVADIAARFGVQVWRAVAIASAADLPNDPGASAALVIEPRPPAGATRPGGNAVALDWSMLRDWKPRFPWLLAGGLNFENVARAIAEGGATAVDVSSGVETAPGCKSAELIGKFVEAAKGRLGGTKPSPPDPPARVWLCAVATTEAPGGLGGAASPHPTFLSS